MIIHHATRAKAEKLGIKLEEIDTDRGSRVRAFDDNDDYNASKATAAVAAVQLARTFAGDYPALKLVQYDDKFVVYHGDADVVTRDGAAPNLADVIDACQDEGLDPEEGFQEDDGTSGGNVVPAHYREEYKARGNPNHCGDWLANQLSGRFDTTIADGERAKKGFDTDAFTAFLVENEVPMEGKWADLPNSGQQGWVGRYRMNGRQKLETTVLQRGTLIVDGKPVQADRDWLEAKSAARPKVECAWKE